jgi:sugar phosphate isomerase/epimerase
MWSIGFAGAQPSAPMSALDLLSKARELRVQVVQFGPNLPLDALDRRELLEITDYARLAGIELEIGTRGIDTQHLCHMLELAVGLGCGLIRTVPEFPDGRAPGREALLGGLREIAPDLDRFRIRLALENGNIAAQELAEILDKLASPWIGITLDTTNSLALPEGTQQVVKTLARHTMCFHIKDFAVQRVWHRMGFTVEGRPAGQGQMDLSWILRELKSVNADPNAILELWTPEQADIEATVALEQSWARESIRYLRRYIAN